MMWLALLLLFVGIDLNNGAGYDWCPQYHTIRASNVYDPSGPIYYEGQWHLFEDSCAWCHFYSDDLLHWKQGENTQFTGLTGSIDVINDNEFIAFYPAGDQSGIMRAISTDNMLSKWTTTGMVIKKPSSATKNYRDPLRPIEINDIKYIGVGSGVAPNGPGMVLWYKALNNNLTQFELLGSLFNVSQTDGCIDSKTIVYNPEVNNQINAIECPDIFLLQDQYVLITGLFCTNEYWVGNMNTNNNQFEPLSADNHALLDYGNFYAAKTGTVANGVNGESRRILFGFSGWSEPTAPSWCGRSQIIPREITLNNHNLLNFEPIREIENIRVGNNTNYGSELQIIFECNLLSTSLPKDGNISINVLVSSDETQYVQIGYDFSKDGYFYVDHSKCCGDNNDIVQGVLFNKSDIVNENGLYFNILLDRSIIETYFNKQKVITTMINPANTTSPQERQISVNNNFPQNFDCDVQAWMLQL